MSIVILTLLVMIISYQNEKKYSHEVSADSDHP